QSVVPMPADFDGIEGPITCTLAAGNTGSVWWPVTTTHEGNVRQSYATTPTRTGRPVQIAEQPLRTTTSTEGQRFNLYVFPIPDQDYSIQFAYRINPDVVTATLPYALGGTAHSETILEACLAVAEERLDDTKSVHADAFARRLQASMSQ